MASSLTYSRSPSGAYQVIVWLRKSAPNRGTLGKSIGSLLGDLLSTGQAVIVFEAQGRQLNVAGADELLEDGPLPTIVAIGARDDRDAMRFLEKFKTNSDVEDCYVAPPRDVLSRKSGVPRNLAASLTKSHWGMEMVGRARAGGARQGDRGGGRSLHRRHRLALQRDAGRAVACRREGCPKSATWRFPGRPWCDWRATCRRPRGR